MPHVKVWVHFVWATKNRVPLLTDDIRARVFEHIKQNAKAKGIFIDHINGWLDHVHCLASLGTEQTVAEVVRLLKGESAHWINQNNLIRGKFQWQHEYFAVGVSESVVGKVRDYIRNQEKHHGKLSFDAEYEAMIGKFGFSRSGDECN